MNKKRLMALPVVCVVVAMIGASVMAAGSAAKNFKVTDENGVDITKDYSGDAFSTDVKLADLGFDGIADAVKAANSEAKIEDAEVVAAYDIKEDVAHSGAKTVEILGISGNASDVFVIVHEDSKSDTLEYNVGTSITVQTVSPFVVYKIAVNSSAQTGEYATPYIAMISVALLACGAVFAVRAKKATK